MKIKYLFFFCIAFIFVGCENDSSKDQSNEDTLTIKVNNNKIIDNENSVVVKENNNNNVELSIKEASFRAYISDPDTVNPTNVRNTPNGDIVLKLELNLDYIIHITACQGRWFKVDMIESDSLIGIPGGAAWIHGSVIGFDTRNYGGQNLNLYEKAKANSKVIDVIDDGEAHLRLVDIEGDWVKVEWNNKGKIVIGWIEKKWTCGNPYTNCC